MGLSAAQECSRRPQRDDKIICSHGGLLCSEGWEERRGAICTAAAQCGGPGRAASSADHQAALKAAGFATCAPHIPAMQKQRATHPEVVALLTSGHSMRSDGFQRAGDGFQNSAQSAAGFSPWMPRIVHAICDSDLTKNKVSAPLISTASPLISLSTPPCFPLAHDGRSGQQVVTSST